MIKNINNKNQCQQTADALEDAIDREYMVFTTAKSRKARADAWEKLQSLIKQRDPERVKQMEIQQGLI